jgi:hypothetical protein
MADKKKIDQITPEQEIVLGQIRDKWIAHGLSTEPSNRPVAEEGIRKAYVAAGLNPPLHVIWVDSPYAGALALGTVPQAIDAAINAVEAAVAKANAEPTTNVIPKVTVPSTTVDYDAVRDWWRSTTYGQHSAGYYAYLEALGYLGVEGLEHAEGAMQVAANAGWWWPAREFVIINERPTAIHRDPQGRLHHETEAAVQFKDGWGVYLWHGTRVPKELIQDKWSTTEILREPNAEVRRCAIEKMGWDRFIKEAKLKRVGKTVNDPGNPGKTLALYDVPERLYEVAVRVLLCDNATPERDGTRRRFGLTVPVEIQNPIEAAAWTFGMSEDAYAKLARAT